MSPGPVTAQPRMSSPGPRFPIPPGANARTLVTVVFAEMDDGEDWSRAGVEDIVSLGKSRQAPPFSRPLQRTMVFNGIRDEYRSR
jgi:hypothetical protein